MIDNQGYTCLHWAAFNGNLEIAEFLINLGCHINVFDDLVPRSTPLDIALSKQNKLIANFLSSKGISFLLIF